MVWAYSLSDSPDYMILKLISKEQIAMQRSSVPCYLINFFKVRKAIWLLLRWWGQRIRIKSRYVELEI